MPAHGGVPDQPANVEPLIHEQCPKQKNNQPTAAMRTNRTAECRDSKVPCPFSPVASLRLAQIHDQLAYVIHAVVSGK
jgi:hypothetical protein